MLRYTPVEEGGGGCVAGCFFLLKNKPEGSLDDSR